MQSVHQATRKPTPASSPYAGQTITKLPNWSGLTAWDIWFNNLSIGVFLVAAAGALVAPAHFAPLTKYAYPLALLLLVVDLALLVGDLGDPARFHHMLRVFKPSSPMSFGTWTLSAYGLLLGIADRSSQVTPAGLPISQKSAVDWRPTSVVGPTLTRR